MRVWALALMGCAGAGNVDSDTDSDVGVRDTPWEVAFETEDRAAQSGVWGSGPADVYSVGGSPGSGTITHFDGEAWSPVSIPQVPLLVWVYGFGPNDIWVVGMEGIVLHYDGSVWATLDAGTTEALWGVWGAGPNDVWLVGGEPDAGDPVFVHYDGVGFETVALDAAQNDRSSRAMFKVWGHAGRTFALGQGGIVVEWDGAAWVQMPTGAEADQDFVALWGTDSDGIFAVGGRSGARVAELSGDTWTTEAPTGYPGLNAISVIDGEVLVGGQFGFVGRWEDGALIQEPSPYETQHDLHAMWSDGEGRTYGVGGRFFAPYEGTAWVRTRP